MNVDLNRLNQIAYNAEQAFGKWFNTHQIADGISDEDAAALIAAMTPATVQKLIALARAGIAAPTGQQGEPVAPGALKAAIVASLNKWETEMEGYSYFGSNPGVKHDDYEDIADEVVAAMSAAPAQPKDTTDTTKGQA